MKTFANANHPPSVWPTTPPGVEAAPGATVKIDVTGSTDPNGDKLSFLWWHYRDPGTHKGEVGIKEGKQAVRWTPSFLSPV